MAENVFVEEVTQSFAGLSTDEQKASNNEQNQNAGGDSANPIVLRAIVTTVEAGVIIGKAGKNVADLREASGVKAGVSPVVQGVHDRVLTVSGQPDQIPKAYNLVANSLLKDTSRTEFPNNPGKLTIRLLISHNLMGTIIGRQGLKIKEIQDTTNVRMVAQKEMLPQSTERAVDVTGTPEEIEKAIEEILKCLADDLKRSVGTILYNPAQRIHSGSGSPYNANRSYPRTGNGSDFHPKSGNYGNHYNNNNNANTNNSGFRNNRTHTDDGEEIQTQNISIPADMVGCIIGRGGSKISEIRKSSGARISIAKAPHDDSGERMFTIMGTTTSNEKALYLLYENLEAEKSRRSIPPPEGLTSAQEK